jgi:uncharacterized protein YdhG (YjbR/CyaY superfamily)
METSGTTTVAAYLDSVPEAARPVLERLRTLVHQAAPADVVEVVSYGIPTLDLAGKHLVHYAGYARHVGLYPGADGIAAFQDELAGYKSAKGSVQFPLDQPLPEDLIRRIVEFRVDVVSGTVKKPRRQGGK